MNRLRRLLQTLTLTLTLTACISADPTVVARAVNATLTAVVTPTPIAEGNRLEVFANGQSLVTLTDATYAEGGFGLYAGSGASETYTATFDNLRVWELKK